MVVSYTYDSWGKVLSTTGSLASSVGANNPFRYRSYYYDIDIGMYYLISRYYDPDTGRFISPDSILSDSSLFAYCGNDPVNYTDSTGTSKFTDWLNKLAELLVNSWRQQATAQISHANNAAKIAGAVAVPVAQTVGAVIDSIEFDVGVGFGMGGSFDILNNFSIEAVASYNIFNIATNSTIGWFYVGSRMYNSIGFSIFNVSKGISEIGYNPVGSFFSETFEYECLSTDTVIGVGASAYFFIGGSFSLGLNVTQFIEKAKSIWR